MPKLEQQVTQASFFDKYAHEYDQLTGAPARTPHHKEELQSLIEDFRPGKVLDAGCGAGLSSMLLATQKIETVGLDRESALIETARKKYDHLNLPLEFIEGSYEALPKKLIEEFDLVICLANGISGLGSQAVLNQGIKGFFDCLKPGGTLVIQMLNFASLTENQVMPIKVTKCQGIIYTRYARRQGRQYSLHIVRIDNTGKEPTFEAFCHDFNNFTPTELACSVKEAGFTSLKRFADIQRKEKFEKIARDLVLVATKPKR